MGIIKICLIAVIGLIIFIYLKNLNSELSALSLVATGIILLLSIVDYLSEAINLFSNLSSSLNINANVFKDCFKSLILLLAPCAPHFAEEIWEMLGNKTSIFNAKYPVCDESALVLDQVEVAVQINSKMRAKIMIPNDANQDTIKEIIYADEKLAQELQDKTIKKLIVVPKRLVNIIV